jgi:hypothetical protein
MLSQDEASFAHLKATLIKKAAEHLKLPRELPQEFIDLNLGFFFSKDEKTANDWFNFIESYYNITIPEDEVDYFFFSDFDHMAKTIAAHIGK